MMQFAPSAPDATLPSIEDSSPPPFSLELEQAVLGCLMTWNHVLEDVQFLAPEHFFDPIHQSIFATIRDLSAGGRGADVLAVRARFKDAAPIREDLSFSQYLGALVANGCSARTVKDRARTIADLAVRRFLILAGEDLSQSARDASHDVSPASLIEEAEARLFALAQEASGTEDRGLRSMQEAVVESVERIYEAYKGGWIGLKIGLTDADSKIGGLQNSDLVVLAGRPSMGKTALATNVGYHVAANQTPVLFFSLEMSAKQLVDRLIAEKIEVSAGLLRTGRVTEANIKAAVAAASTLSSLPFYIDQTGGLSITQITTRARRAKRKHNVGLIIIDYLQLMRPSGQRQYNNRVQDITEITTGLKALAKELDVPILALSQLSRETERRETKRPQLSDLRESGSIEQDADIVLFVFREEYYLEREQPPLSDGAAHADWQAAMQAAAGKAEIIVGKNRHGETGTVSVAFNGELTRFSNLAGVRHGL